MKVLLAPSLNGLHRLKLLRRLATFTLLTYCPSHWGAACITKLSIKLLGSSDLARGFSASDLSCTPELRVLTCESYRVVELMRIPTPPSDFAVFDCAPL